MHTMSDLVLGDFAFFLDIQPAHVHVPFALPACRCSNTDLGRGWRRQPFNSTDTYNVLAHLLHLDVGNVSCNIAIVV